MVTLLLDQSDDQPDDLKSNILRNVCYFLSPIVLNV